MIRRHWEVSIVCLLLLLGALVACQREAKELAGVRANPASPKYKVKADVNHLPGDVHLASVAPVVAPLGPNGQELFQAHCVACHQVNGAGVPTVFPPLIGSPFVIGDNTERLASIMLYGLIGPIKVKGMDYNSVMTPFSHLSDAELAAVADYIRTSWGNSAPAVDLQVFAAQRKRWGERGQFRIEELGAEE